MNELLVKPAQAFDFSRANKERFVYYFKNDPKLKYWNLSEGILDKLPENTNNFEVFVSLLSSYKNQIKPGASIVLFKAERLIHLFDNLVNPDSLHEVFFLSIIRDCRGVYASQKQTIFPGTDKYMSRNPVQTTMNWKIHVKKALEMQKSGKLVLIKFEELISSSGNVFSKLLKKLNIPYYNSEGKKGDLYDRLPESHQMIHSGILKKPDGEKIENWKSSLTKTERCIIEIIAGQSLLVFYNRLDKHICPLSTWPVLGYYFIEYICRKMVKKVHFYRRNGFFNFGPNSIIL